MMKIIFKFFIIALFLSNIYLVNAGSVFEYVELNKYDLQRNFIYSSDGKSFSYIAKKDIGKWVTVKDGIESEEYYDISNLKYSPDGKSLSFIAKKDNGKMVVVKDGVESKEYDDIYFNFEYSPDSKTLSFIAVDGGVLVENDGNYLLVRDGIESNKYDIIDNFNYFKDGSLVFIAEKNGKKILIIDGVEGKKNDDIYFDFQYLSDDDSFVFIAENDGKKILVENGVENNNYDYIYDFTYSPDGKSSAFIAGKKTRKRILEDRKTIFRSYTEFILVKDGIEIEKYDDLNTAYNLEFSLDNNSLAFVAMTLEEWKKRHGKEILIKDGVRS